MSEHSMGMMIRRGLFGASLAAALAGFGGQGAAAHLERFVEHLDALVDGAHARGAG